MADVPLSLNLYHHFLRTESAYCDVWIVRQTEYSIFLILPALLDSDLEKLLRFFFRFSQPSRQKIKHKQNHSSAGHVCL